MTILAALPCTTLGLLGLLYGPPSSAPDDAPVRPPARARHSHPRPPARVYTNEDLERVRPYRAETGVASVAASTPAPPHAGDHASRAAAEKYWRGEAEKARQRMSALAEQLDDLRARLTERRNEADRARGRNRRGGLLDADAANRSLLARIAAVERRMRAIEDDLSERARREGALPGWLR